MDGDLLKGLQDALKENSEGAPGEGEAGGDPAASIDKFLESIQNMAGMSEEDKDKLIQGLSALTGNKLPIGKPIEDPRLEFLVLFGTISLVILLLALIGYKLYKSSLDKELRREQKKLLKEQKKKK
ncbi:uncharacterized protein LOC126736568 [Anthonomus grandis grandis]|uniref:uncharacterized protein LOC126736568 n=1 Tax=Anthonomus grandis grandis TaxID=2921223 RepID=UPI002166AA5C|nr:uncharacterized protein LOC126736568 [Anthonomus grandis grandis]